MLEALLDPDQVDLTVTTAAMLAAEVVALVEEKRPALLCVGALPPGGAAHARLLSTRLHARFPDLKILVGRWGMEHAEDATLDPLLAAGAYLVAPSLEETRNQVCSRRSTFRQRRPRRRTKPRCGSRTPPQRNRHEAPHARRHHRRRGPRSFCR